MTRILGCVVILSMAMLAARQVAAGETFVLENGGTVVGEILNPDQSPRTTYVIKTAEGAEITLEKAQVKQIIHQRADEVEYDKIRTRYPDTVDGQWELAEWCREKRLSAQRKKHLQRIIQLEPDHEQARRALGYSQIDGQWMTQEEAMTKQGYRFYQGRWRLPQEIEVLEKNRNKELAETEWMKKVSTWRGWLGTDKARIARENILAINDPQATKALTMGLQEDPRDQVRLLCAEALARIGTSDALYALAKQAMNDQVEEVCLTCLDYLKEKKSTDAVNYFIGYLRNKDNVPVNRAGAALRHMGDPSAIGPLIDALVTIHKHKTSTSGGSSGGDQYSMTFGNGGSGLGVGGGPRVVSRTVENRAVLEALVELTGGVNYGYDVRAWKSWYTAQKKRPQMNARRGEEKKEGRTKD